MHNKDKAKENEAASAGNQTDKNFEELAERLLKHQREAEGPNKELLIRFISEIQHLRHEIQQANAILAQSGSDRYLNSYQAQQYLSMSESKLKDFRKRRKLTFFCFDKNMRYLKSDLDKLLKKIEKKSEEKK